MKYLSSIFSFDSLRLSGLRPWGALTALGLLLLVELCIARQPWIWHAKQESPVWVQRVIEEEIVETGSAPVVAVVGNSRILAMVDPDEMERALGLPPGAVINAAITEGTPFDCLNLYRTHREKLSQSRLLIVGLDSWQCQGRTRPHERVRCYASWDDRIKYFSGEERLSLLAGYVWRTYDAHKPIGRLARGFALGGEQRNIIVGRRSRWNPHENESMRGPTLVNVSPQAEAFYGGFVPGSESFAPLRDLAALAHEDGVEIAFCRPPFRDGFIDMVRSRWPEAENQLRSQVAATLGASGVQPSQFVFDRASEVGVPADYFSDYGHLLPVGAKMMSRILATDLLKQYGPGFFAAATGASGSRGDRARHWQREPDQNVPQAVSQTYHISSD